MVLSARVAPVAKVGMVEPQAQVAFWKVASSSFVFGERIFGWVSYELHACKLHTYQVPGFLSLISIPF